MENTISLIWGIEDVLSLDDSLTEDQAREVLQAVKYNHDASIGVNWDTIQHFINRVKEQEA